MVDFEEMRQAAKHLAPSAFNVQDHLSKPNRLVIAVERHDKDTDEWRTFELKDRFVFIMGRCVSEPGQPQS